MSKKHHTKHNRSQSKYPERLKRRGQTTASVRMSQFHTPEARNRLRKRTGGAPQEEE